MLSHSSTIAFRFNYGNLTLNITGSSSSAMKPALLTTFLPFTATVILYRTGVGHFLNAEIIHWYSPWGVPDAGKYTAVSDNLVGLHFLFAPRSGVSLPLLDAGLNRFSTSPVPGSITVRSKSHPIVHVTLINSSGVTVLISTQSAGCFALIGAGENKPPTFTSCIPSGIRMHKLDSPMYWSADSSIVLNRLGGSAGSLLTMVRISGG